MDRPAAETYPFCGGYSLLKPGAENSLTLPSAAQVLYCEIDGMEVDVTPHDFSPAGFFVQTISVPSYDAEVEIFLRSDVGSITVNAVVVKVVTLDEAALNNITPGFGALFTDLSDSDRIFLARTTDEVRRSMQPAPPPAPAPAPKAKAKAEPKPRSKPDPVLPKRMSKPIRVTRESLQPDLRPSSDPDKQSAHVLSEVQAMLERDSQRTAWRVLGVSAEASVKEAKRAFLALAKQHHPHVYARHKSPQINAVATRLFILHKKAYSDFCKDTARKAAQDKLTIPQPSASPPQEQGTQHTARLWNERRGKADG